MRTRSVLRSSAALPLMLVVGCGSDLVAPPRIDPPIARASLASDGLALPEGIGFDIDDLVDEVFLTVQRGFTYAPFAVEIEITSVDGFPGHHHGAAVVPLSEVTVLLEDQRLADISVPWTHDAEPTVQGDIYTVCATLVWPNEDKVGETTCRDFGPFF